MPVDDELDVLSLLKEITIKEKVIPFTLKLCRRLVIIKRHALVARWPRLASADRQPKDLSCCAKQL